MKIERIISQNRRDFEAEYVCEHCGHKHEGSGYDDANFHETVIPEMKCPVCDKKADANYRPLATRHAAHVVV